MKKNLIRVGFVVVLAATLYLAASVLSIKSEHGVNQATYKSPLEGCSQAS